MGEETRKDTSIVYYPRGIVQVYDKEKAYSQRSGK